MILTWDWKYRVYFDESVRQEVLDFLPLLSVDECRVYEELIAFYTTHFSLTQLLDAIDRQPLQSDALITKAIANLNQLILTPSCLWVGLSARAHDKRILHMLDKGVDFSKDYWKLNPDYCGDFMSATIDLPIPHGERFSDSITTEFSKLYSALQSNEILISKFGACAIKDFDICLDKDAGFAEWWDKHISNTEHDTLVLHDNADARYYNDFVYTVLHETYPGHGHFYNTITTPVFDQGAMSLIEGWATYVEWNSIPSPYASACRHNAMVFLHNSYSLSADDFANSIVARKHQQGYSKQEALRSALYATQYPGFLESYYLGALFFEHSNMSLRELNERHCGELIKLWA